MSELLRAELRPTRFAELRSYDFRKNAGLLEVKLACAVMGTEKGSVHGELKRGLSTHSNKTILAASPFN